MEVSRTRRFAAALINGFTLNGFIIIGLILLIAKRTSVGGLVMGYKFKGSLVALWLCKILAWILYGITFSIFFWIDIIGMGNRNGTFAEKWSGCRKHNA